MATALASTPSWQSAVRYCTSCLAIYRTDFDRCPLDGGVLAVSASDPLIGTTLGAYVLESKLGEGGMGRVYRAHRLDDPSKEVAVKVLLGDLAASHVMRQRFAREAESARHLAHDNIVGVLDFGHTKAGLPYMAMELVEGTNLAVILQKGPMPGDRVIRIARQLCLALDHAHSRGVIHRDFKPDNILVINEGPDERVKVADFGLALSQNDETRLTMTGVACTPAYAAPEQLRGDTIDGRVDLYALGTTMFEMLTGGMLPFESDLQGTIRLKLAGEAPSLNTIVPDMQPALATLVGRLLSYDPDRRPRSARSLIIALDAALQAPKRKLRTADLAPQVKEPTISFPPTEHQRRRRAATTRRLRKPRQFDLRTYIALAVAALMIGGALATLLRGREPEAQAQPAPIAMTAPSSPIVVTPAAAPVMQQQPVTAAAAPIVAKQKPRRARRIVHKHVTSPPRGETARATQQKVPTPTQPEAIFENAPTPMPTPVASNPTPTSATSNAATPNELTPSAPSPTPPASAPPPSNPVDADALP